MDLNIISKSTDKLISLFGHRNTAYLRRSYSPKTLLSYFYLILHFMLICGVSGFWDSATTTEYFTDPDKTPRQSFFRWEFHANQFWSWWNYHYDWPTIKINRRLRCTAGISIDMIPLGTAVILNRRTLITAANYLEPYLDRQQDLRIWALGRAGRFNTPFRYRVWRVRRVIPKSDNPEHWHGPTGDHVPRHDVCVIHSHDQMYVAGLSTSYIYAHQAWLPEKRDTLEGDNNQVWVAGSGYMNQKHVRENYRVRRGTLTRDDIVDCSKYLPKWWGKFICLINIYGYTGVQNGGGLYISKGDMDYIMGLGCFEIRYNDDKIMVFTDLRYYVDWIKTYANITPGDYYEYAYPKWSVTSGHFIFWDSSGNNPYIPTWQIRKDMYPLG